MKRPFLFGLASSAIVVIFIGVLNLARDLMAFAPNAPVGSGALAIDYSILSIVIGVPFAWLVLRMTRTPDQPSGLAAMLRWWMDGLRVQNPLSMRPPPPRKQVPEGSPYGRIGGWVLGCISGTVLLVLVLSTLSEMARLRWPAS
jgi:hypothetical protein